jgi:hypothetical protein
VCYMFKSKWNDGCGPVQDCTYRVDVQGADCGYSHLSLRNEGFIRSALNSDRKP